MKRRLRAQNSQKRYRPADYFAELDSSEEAVSDAAAAADENDSAVDDFDGDEDEDDDDDDDDAGNDSKAETASESASADSSDLDGHRPVRRVRRASQPSSRAHKTETAKPPGEVRPYPADPAAKWTRTYVGPLTRWARFGDLCQFWFGDQENYERVAQAYTSIWAYQELAPPKLTSPAHLSIARSPWMPSSFCDDQEVAFRLWYERYQSARSNGQRSAPVPRATALPHYLPHPDTKLIALLGPFNDQREYTFRCNHAIALTHDSLPSEGTGGHESAPGAFLLDVGGIVLSMGWAPTKGRVDQLLAMTVVPFSDQAYYETPDEAPKESTLKQGSIQIWGVATDEATNGTMSLSKSPPRLLTALCFEWGRAVRMQWCPVPLTVESRAGLLAVLCKDGRIRVIEVKQPKEQNHDGAFEEIQEPLATLEIKNEYHVEVNCFTWLNVNRIAAGLSDGSVAVWSIHPLRLLQRHPVHSSPIIDIASSYPSQPFIVVTVPVGGVATITDLSRPNAELVYCPNLLIDFQPNLLAWSEHMRAYISIWPSAFPASGVISFMSIRIFNQARLLLSLEGQPTSLAVGACHPYALVGSSDGSLWIVNVFRKSTFYRKPSQKLKLFQHEHQALPSHLEARNAVDKQEKPRGVCRILHGFRPQLNIHPKASRGKQMRKKQLEEQAKRNKKKKASSATKKGQAKQETSTVGDDGVGSDSDGEGTAVTGEVAVHDPLSRISAVCWNPNLDFSWWAAAAMGSGLVKIMDLGSEPRPSRKDRRRDSNGSEAGGSEAGNAPSSDVEALSDEEMEGFPDDSMGELNDEIEDAEMDEDGWTAARGR